MIRMVVALTLAFVSLVALRPAPHTDAALDFRQIIVNMLDGMNRQDIKAVMSYYADDAESRGSASCDCKGKAGIEKDNLETLEIRPQFTIVSIRETQSGMGTVKVMMISPVFADGCPGVSRVLLTAQMLTANEKIVKEIVEFDRTDEQTRLLVACMGDEDEMTPQRMG